MKQMLGVCVGLVLLVPILAEEQKPAKKDDGFVSLFDGKSLKGWVRVNNAPGTFYVNKGHIVTTGKPTGFMRSEKMYENFILELEWKHVPPTPKAVGNSGLFVWADGLPAVGTPFARAIEVQVLVNLEWKDKKSGGVTASSHGDIFSIWGAKCVPDRPHPLKWERCIPSENRAKGANEWNLYRVEAKDGVIKLAVNGKVVSGVSKATPRKGYLALEAEGSECRFKNIKIKELPSSKPKKEDIAREVSGYETLFTGLNLDGWDGGDDAKKHWKVGDNVLNFDGKGKELKTKKKYGAYELTFDFRGPKDARGYVEAGNVRLPLKQGQGGKYNRVVVKRQKGKTVATINGKEVEEVVVSDKAPFEQPITLAPGSAVSFMNLFVKEMKE